MEIFIKGKILIHTNMLLDQEQASKLVEAYYKGEMDNIDLADTILTIEHELANPMPQTLDDPDAVYVNMGYVGFVSSLSKSQRLKTVGAGSCLYLISESSQNNGMIDRYGSAAHCAYSLDTDDLIERIVIAHHQKGVNPDQIRFKIFATGAVDQRLLNEVQDAVTKYTGKPIPEENIENRNVHSSCFLYDFEQGEAFEFPGLDMENPENQRLRFQPIPPQGSRYELVPDERLNIDLTRLTLDHTSNYINK